MLSNWKKRFSLIHNKTLLPCKVYKLFGLKDYYNNLINVNDMEENIVFCLVNKKAFNTIAFNYDVDVVLLDKNKNVICLFQNVKPNKISEYFEESHYCLFFNTNSIEVFGIKINDQLFFKY